MRKRDFAFIFLIVLVYLAAFSGILNLATVDGVSMYPVFQNGALTFYSKDSLASTGNVVIYYSPQYGTYIIHRVIRVYDLGDERAYVTQGVDKITNPLPDTTSGYEPGYGIPQNYVQGVVIQFDGVMISIPYLGYLSLIFRL
jgi:signal peptidase